jgi:hypothetical protein
MVLTFYRLLLGQARGGVPLVELVAEREPAVLNFEEPHGSDGQIDDNDV